MPYNLDILDPDNLGLEDLAKMEENFNILDESRIVEHNLDVSDPSNGYYVRWENGLQICWEQLNLNYVNQYFLIKKWDFSAGFSFSPKVFISLNNRLEDIDSISYNTPVDSYLVGHNTNKDNVDIRLQSQGAAFESGDGCSVFCFAIGRWK